MYTRKERIRVLICYRLWAMTTLAAVIMCAYGLFGWAKIDAPTLLYNFTLLWVVTWASTTIKMWRSHALR